MINAVFIILFNDLHVFLLLGDPRRPYPQDTEMRAGILGRLSTTGKLSSDDTEGDSSGKGAIGTPSIG